MPTTVNNSHPFNHPDVGQIADNSDRALQMTQDLEKDDNFYYTKRLVDRYWCFRLFFCQAECEYGTKCYQKVKYPPHSTVLFRFTMERHPDPFFSHLLQWDNHNDFFWCKLACGIVQYCVVLIEPPCILSLAMSRPYAGQFFKKAITTKSQF